MSDEDVPSEIGNMSDEDSVYHAQELSALALIATLPQELQNQIFELSDVDELLVLCQLNKHWYEKTIPWIWADIDLVTDIDPYDSIDQTRRFFALCDKLIDAQPERWAVLAANVRNFNVGRLHGIKIVHENWDGDDYLFFCDGTGDEASRRNVFHVIAQFTNLETLSVYVKNQWYYQESLDTMKLLSRGLKNLKSLRIGGQMPGYIVRGLLHKPEIIEHLSVINLHSRPGQVDGPDGEMFLSVWG